MQGCMQRLDRVQQLQRLHSAPGHYCRIEVTSKGGATADDVHALASADDVHALAAVYDRCAQPVHRSRNVWSKSALST